MKHLILTTILLTSFSVLAQPFPPRVPGPVIISQPGTGTSTSSGGVTSNEVYTIVSDYVSTNGGSGGGIVSNLVGATLSVNVNYTNTTSYYLYVTASVRATPNGINFGGGAIYISTNNDASWDSVEHQYFYTGGDVTPGVTGGELGAFIPPSGKFVYTNLSTGGATFVVLAGSAQLTYFATNGAVVFATSAGSAATATTSTRIINVSSTGNDSTGTKYSTALPFATLVAANAAAVAGDIVDVGPGLFSGIITNKAGVQYRFGAATIWSNATPNTLIHMDVGGTVDYVGRGIWKADTVFDTSPFGVSNIVGKIEAAEIHPITTPSTGFALLIADGYDNISFLVTNGAGFVDLKIIADVAELSFYSHIFSAAPLNRSVGTNANYSFDVGRLKLNVGDEAQTNWTYTIAPRDFVIASITGSSARFIVNGGKLISTNTWSHDAANFAANTLVMNDVFLIGTNLPPVDYYSGIWRTNDTNIVIKAAQFIGNQYGALHFFNTGSPQAVNASGSPSPMINYTRAITNGFFSNKSSGLITNRNAGVFEIAFSATATATLLPTTFRIYTNTVATDIGGVVSAFGGDIGTAGVGILEIPAMTQIKLMLDGDDVTVSTASLIARRLQ